MSDNAIQRIQAGDLRGMSDREGLILQGCGGDPQEWLEGINEMLTDAGILRNGSRFERASLFEYDGHTNMLFDFEGVTVVLHRLFDFKVRIRHCRDLRKVGNAEYLVLFSDIGQTLRYLLGSPSTDTGIDLIEDQRWNIVRVRKDRLDRQHNS